MANRVVQSLLRNRSAPAIRLLRSSSPSYNPPPATMCKAFSSLACAPLVAGRKFEEMVPALLIRRISLSTLPERLIETEVLKPKSGDDFVELNEEEIRRANAKWKELVNKNKELEDKNKSLEKEVHTLTSSSSGGSFEDDNKSIEEQVSLVVFLVATFCFVTLILSLTFALSYGLLNSLNL